MDMDSSGISSPIGSIMGLNPVADEAAGSWQPPKPRPGENQAQFIQRMHQEALNAFAAHQYQNRHTPAVDPSNNGQNGGDPVANMTGGYMGPLARMYAKITGQK